MKKILSGLLKVILIMLSVGLIGCTTGEALEKNSKNGEKTKDASSERTLSELSSLLQNSTASKIGPGLSRRLIPAPFTTEQGETYNLRRINLQNGVLYLEDNSPQQFYRLDPADLSLQVAEPIPQANDLTSTNDGYTFTPPAAGMASARLQGPGGLNLELPCAVTQAGVSGFLGNKQLVVAQTDRHLVLYTSTGKKITGQPLKDVPAVIRGFLDNFHMYLPPAVQGRSKLESPSFGYTLDLSATDWRKWPDIGRDYEYADSGATYGSTTALMITPLYIAGLIPSLENLSTAFLKKTTIQTEDSTISDYRKLKTDEVSWKKPGRYTQHSLRGDTGKIMISTIT